MRNLLEDTQGCFWKILEKNLIKRVKTAGRFLGDVKRKIGNKEKNDEEYLTNS